MPSRHRSLRMEAVVLRHSDWGEADRLLSVFTREQGKLRVVAKGVRRLRSRKAGHLEPFTRVSLQLARGRDTLIITQAEAVDAYLPVRENLMRLSYASYIVELLDRFTYEEGENAALYRLLIETLARLADPASADEALQLAVRYYEMRLLDLVGFRPRLFECANCGKELLPQDQYFSAELGGVLCPECGRARPGAVPISQPTLRFLRHFQRSSYAEAQRARPSTAEQREMETLQQHYLTYLLERGLNTPAFLRRMRSLESS